MVSIFKPGIGSRPVLSTSPARFLLGIKFLDIGETSIRRHCEFRRRY